MKSYGILRLCGQVLSIISAVVLAVMIGATFLNLFYGRDIDGATGDWLKLVIALGVGQSFIAIADSAERILALGDRLSEDSGGIRRHMQNPESSQQEGEKTQ